jgi:hypothetical protein
LVGGVSGLDSELSFVSGGVVGQQDTWSVGQTIFSLGVKEVGIFSLSNGVVILVDRDNNLDLLWSEILERWCITEESLFIFKSCLLFFMKN